MHMANPPGFALLLKKASLVGAFFVGAIWQLSAEAFCPAPEKPRQVTVRHVVDGDTLRLADGRSVRLIGINAPEIGRRGKASEPFAEVARRRLQALVKASDDRIGLVAGAESKDRYGRTLAHAYGRGGVNLESVLLGEGLGYRIVIPPNGRLADCQLKAEQAARKARLGVWRQSPARRPNTVRQAGFAVIAGRVSSIERNRGGLWLTLDGAVVVQVPGRQLKRFPSGFFDSLKGRQIEVRGWVRDRSSQGGLKPDRSRWLLPLTDPGMLEVSRR
ncbi:thermonuclease family protein [Pseudomonas capeferrum]|uniref:thermonuclease family protein n=1 Tax=Pseudomonas capeferrum TaxID=1495066 RepID=UPI0015E334D3|nr:thermonuclease family protein [Pseudomonas capeferrum]MBA1202354.1 thermonuclease family protein [Pseudomonas capeferrum]